MNLRIILIASLFLAPAAYAQRGDQSPPPLPLRGRIDGDVYVSPTGIFRMSIPVRPELGGSVIDTDNVVTFDDAFSTHVSVAMFAQDAAQRTESEARGRHDYLLYFFSTYVMPDFQQRSTGAKIESSQFLPDVQGGALIVYTLLPGGSMFADRVSLTGEPDPSLVAKRGNLLFVQDGRVFIISTELAERVLEHSTYNKTTAEENDLLQSRLLDLLARITFSDPAAAAAKK